MNNKVDFFLIIFFLSAAIKNRIASFLTFHRRLKNIFTYFFCTVLSVFFSFYFIKKLRFENKDLILFFFIQKT